MSSNTELSELAETTVDEVRTLIENYLHDLDSRLSSQDIEQVLMHGRDDLDSSDLKMKPEKHAEEELIYPLFKLFGIEKDPQAYGQSGNYTVWPDFRITNIEPTIIGENKSYNNVDRATDDIKDYLDRKSIGAEYGIITDGLQWRIFKIELGGDTTDYPEIIEPQIDLRAVIAEIARDLKIIGASTIGSVDVEEKIIRLINNFDAPCLENLVSARAPKILRDNRKRDVEAFYDLYIKLLFGEGDDKDEKYDTYLLNEIRSPKSADDTDERLFAVSLMNRLLFVKFLESNEVVPEGLLSQRVDFYQSNRNQISGTMYSTQIKPIFYDLLDTKKPRPKNKHNQGWFNKVPYLNGGLFRPTIGRNRDFSEKDFDVDDNILPAIISDLIEGSELNLNGEGYDPAIIGAVFEKTINHIEKTRESDDEDVGQAQKEKGAYYTPTDITNISIERAVDPKIRDVLIETFVDEVADDEGEEQIIRSQLEDKTLAEILENVENGASWYASPEALENVRTRLSNLKILDPACGSGHFLTASMDEVYRAQVSIHKGQNGGTPPNDKERYEIKREIALNGIYGVDAERLATEIAKLRLWLKIVEQNSWNPDFGQLPNIDINIRHGNSLIGYPLQGNVETSLDIPDIEDEIQEVIRLRESYRDEEIDDKDEIERLEEEIRPRLNESYLSQLNFTKKTKPDENDEAIGVLESASNTLHTDIEEVQLKPEDRGQVKEQQTFEQLGFTTYKKSASLDVKSRERSLSNNGVKNTKRPIVEDIEYLLEQGYECTRIERRPVPYDLQNTFGSANHWIAEFPEARAGEDSTEVEFDIIVGNPPYGADVLGYAEETLIEPYITSGLDIVAPFIERQLSLLDDDGYFGNVTSLKIAFDSDMKSIIDILRNRLDETTMSCFAKRPRCVFEGVEVRIALISGQVNTTEDTIEENIYTSEFIRFNEQDRNERLHGLEHRNIDDYILNEDGIGGNDDYVAIPKIGTERIEGIVQKLRDMDDTISERKSDSNSNHAIWRREGQDYFVAPHYDRISGYDPRELRPFYFDTDLEARTAFLGICSSLYYVYWCVYADQYHVNLSHIDAFPMPSEDLIQENKEEIIEKSDELWEQMLDTWDSNRNQFRSYKPLKPYIDKAEPLVGDLYGLTEEEVAFLQQYHTQYERHGSKNYELDEYLVTADDD